MARARRDGVCADAAGSRRVGEEEEDEGGYICAQSYVMTHSILTAAHRCAMQYHRR
jgi:hypothetical protein